MFTINKRKFLRLPAHHLLRYKISGKPETSGGTLSFVRNISAGGALFHCSERIEPGSTLELEIKFPSSENIIKIKARVVRAVPLRKMGGFDIAVEFSDLMGDIRKGIDKKIVNSYNKSEEEGIMKQVAMLALILAVISILISVGIKFNIIPVIIFGKAAWLKITHTFLFFSIACSLLKR